MRTLPYYSSAIMGKWQQETVNVGVRTGGGRCLLATARVSWAGHFLSLSLSFLWAAGQVESGVAGEGCKRVHLPRILQMSPKTFCSEEFSLFACLLCLVVVCELGFEQRLTM